MEKKFEQMEENGGEFDFDDDDDEEDIPEIGLIFLSLEKTNSIIL
jgi:hypothetical protein